MTQLIENAGMLEMLLEKFPDPIYLRFSVGSYHAAIIVLFVIFTITRDWGTTGNWGAISMILNFIASLLLTPFPPTQTSMHSQVCASSQMDSGPRKIEGQRMLVKRTSQKALEVLRAPSL